jgi:hypothetical protein
VSARTREMPEDLDLLPTQDVGQYVLDFAMSRNVVQQRTVLDHWAESVTRASGDDVRLDHTGQLLVTLKKANLINGRQLARLMTNHMREQKARSERGLTNALAYVPACSLSAPCRAVGPPGVLRLICDGAPNARAQQVNCLCAGFCVGGQRV